MMDHQIEIQNIDSPFTEIFSLLVKYKPLSDGALMLAYNKSELVVISQHIDNAITTLLHGTQNIGRLVSIVLQEKKDLLQEVKDIGFLLSGITNLVEALYTLRLDTDSLLAMQH